MVQTRSQAANKLSRRKVYRHRVKTSHCRGKPRYECTLFKTCKNTKTGKRRAYCRKRSNKRV